MLHITRPPSTSVCIFFHFGADSQPSPQLIVKQPTIASYRCVAYELSCCKIQEAWPSLIKSHLQPFPIPESSVRNLDPRSSNTNPLSVQTCHQNWPSRSSNINPLSLQTCYHQGNIGASYPFLHSWAAICDTVCPRPCVVSANVSASESQRDPDPCGIKKSLIWRSGFPTWCPASAIASAWVSVGRFGV